MHTAQRARLRDAVVLRICADTTMPLPLVSTSLTIAGRGPCQIMPFVQIQLTALHS